MSAARNAPVSKAWGVGEIWRLGPASGPTLSLVAGIFVRPAAKDRSLRRAAGVHVRVDAGVISLENHITFNILYSIRTLVAGFDELVPASDSLRDIFCWNVKEHYDTNLPITGVQVSKGVAACRLGRSGEHAILRAWVRRVRWCPIHECSSKARLCGVLPAGVVGRIAMTFFCGANARMAFCRPQ